MKNLCLVFILVFTQAILFSQESIYKAFVNADSIWKEEKENYIKPLLYLEQLNRDSFSKRQNNMYFDAITTYSSFVCDFEKTLFTDILRRKNFYPATVLSEQIQDSSFFDYRLISARNAIDSLARRYEVIMINESHHTPYHRNLVFSLLPDLKRQGFEYLALEALSKDHKINKTIYTFVL